MENRSRLLRRLDMLFLIGLLVTSGLAAIFFSAQYRMDKDSKKATAAPATAAVLSSPTVTYTPTLTLTATPTATATLPPAPLVVAPLPVAEIHAGEALIITGNTQPGATVTLYDGDQITAQTAADPTGDWAITLPDGLPAGPHQLSIQAVGSDGSTSEQIPVGIEVSSAPTASWTPLPTDTATPTSTPNPTVTATPRPTQTNTATVIPTNTATAVPSSTPRPTMTPSLTFTATVAPSSTLRPTQTAYPTNTATPAPSSTPRPTQTPYPTNTATTAPTNTATTAPSNTPRPTQTPYPTNTATVVPTNITAANPVLPSSTPIPPDSGQGGLEVGQAPSLTPTTAANSIPPHIDSPTSGETVAPGTIPVRGTGQPGTVVEIINQGAGTMIAAVPVNPNGSWETAVILEGAGKETLIAAFTSADGTRLESDPVEITLAPPVQPQTGSHLKGDPDETGRTFTALLALLLAAGGFSAYFAGRLLYLAAHDRLKPR